MVTIYLSILHGEILRKLITMLFFPKETSKIGICAILIIII